MKPLIIITLPEDTTEKVRLDTDEYFNRLLKNGFLDQYEILVIQGCTAKVYYPSTNWLKFYFYKIKAWLILKIAKRK